MKSIRRNSQLYFLLKKTDKDSFLVHYSFRGEKYWIENKSKTNACFKIISPSQFESLLKNKIIVFKEKRYFSEVFKFDKTVLEY